MKARGRLVFLVCAAAAFLALPAAAAAGSQIELHPGGTELQIPLGGRHDYFVSLSAEDGQRVKLLADEPFSSASYSVDGHVSSSRIEADFESLGRVDVKIRLQRRRPEPLPAGKNCRGRPTIALRGTYHGTIEFAGERDIPAVRSKHGPITFIHRFRRVCRKPQLPSGQGGKESKSAIEFGVLTASGQGEGRTTRFQAFDAASKQDPALSFGILLAVTYERPEQVLIARSTVSFAGEEELIMSKRSKVSETFKVAPEEPFSGKAVLSRSRRSPSTWTGDLSVRLPGARPLPLTGPSFSASLCRAWTLSRFTTCLSEISARSRPLILERLAVLR